MTLSKLGLFAAIISALCIAASMARAEEQANNSEENENEPPPREVPNFFEPPPTLQRSAERPSSSSPVAGETEEAGESERPGIGKFERLPFRLTLSVAGGYDDNVITTNVHGNGSGYINPKGELNYKFGDARTEITLRASAGVSYYFNRAPTPAPTATATPPVTPTPTPTPKPSTQDYDITLSLGASIVHKASSRLTLGGTVYLTYQTEPDFSTSVGSNRRSGNYFYSSNKAFLNYVWLPRFVTSTSYSPTFVRYDDFSYGESQDRNEHLLGTEFRFLYTRQTALLADLRLQIVDYEHSSTSNSVSELLLGGLEHTLSPRMNVSLRGGWQHRTFEDDRTANEPYFEASLSYAAGERTVVSWNNSYRLEEPGVSGNQPRTTFRTGLQARHGFTGRISANIGLFYVHDSYAEGPPVVFFGLLFPGPPPFVENSVDFSLGVHYELKRNLTIDVGYGHTEVTSTHTDVFGKADRDYSRNRYFAGLTLSF